MDFALIYLPWQALYRVGQFFHHWYRDGSRYFVNHFISVLENLDHTFAVRVTLEHFFEPLYKDYSVIGRILGIVFRTVRILIGAAVYVLCAFIFLVFYIAWLALPPGLIAYVLLNV